MCIRWNQRAPVWLWSKSGVGTTDFAACYTLGIWISCACFGCVSASTYREKNTEYVLYEGGKKDVWLFLGVGVLVYEGGRRERDGRSFLKYFVSRSLRSCCSCCFSYSFTPYSVSDLHFRSLVIARIHRPKRPPSQTWQWSKRPFQGTFGRPRNRQILSG